jgi:N6-adenosine-specific RNA methylase IME4
MTAGIKKYSVIYADPPWRFQNFSAKGEGRNAIAHYDCLDADNLSRLPVANYAAPNCTLLVWATDPLLPEAFRVINSWGFKYRTVGFYWAKLNKTANLNGFTSDDFFSGLGYWTRANVEQCLLATRGKPQRISKSVRKLCIAPRREHSRKPDEIYSRIEALLAGPYLELFARGTRPGWDHWGDQAGLFDSGPVDTRRFPSELKQQRLPL